MAKTPGTTPGQPANPPQGTSPSPSIERAAKDSWNGWHQHGNKDAKGALADKHTDNPVNPSGNK